MDTPAMDTPEGAASHDLSFIGLVVHADVLVQGVILGLVLLSIASWSIILDKLGRLRRIRRTIVRLEAAAEGGGTLDADEGLPLRLMAAAQREAEGAAAEGTTGLRGRIEEAMRAVCGAELRRLQRGLSLLATIGSAAPFVGLFGTVWGIMRSFTAIAGAKDTSLAVVAPGIAEALIATAIGLAAAIPAVVAYNQIASAIGDCAQRAGAAVAILARDFAWSNAAPDARRALR